MTFSPEDFFKAVQSGFQNYLEIKGRASRAAYWQWTGFVVACNLLALLLDNIMGSTLKPIVLVGFLVPNITYLVRRLHDIDKSGWWTWIGFVPVLGWMVLLSFTLARGHAEDNRYGPALY